MGWGQLFSWLRRPRPGDRGDVPWPKFSQVVWSDIVAQKRIVNQCSHGIPLCMRCLNCARLPLELSNDDRPRRTAG